MKVTGNSHFIQLLSWFELTDKEQSEFDFSDKENASYFHYKNWCYCLSDFMKPESDLGKAGFHGIYPETYFSGILVKLHQEAELIQVYRYHVI